MTKLTKKELQHVNWALRSMITWGEGGCFIDENNEIDQKAIEIAIKALKKLEILETLAK